LGLRWVELHEEFRVAGASALPIFVNEFGTQTGNSLYGLQIGVARRFFDRGGALEVDGFLKAGGFRNHAKQVTSTVGSVTPPITVGDRGDETSFLGELGLTAKYRFGDQVSVRAGYQVTWIDGVALAPDQIPFIDVTPNTPGSATLNANSTMLYHGFQIGLEVVW
jgi:hypothetical protein